MSKTEDAFIDWIMSGRLCISVVPRYTNCGMYKQLELFNELLLFSNSYPDFQWWIALLVEPRDSFLN